MEQFLKFVGYLCCNLLSTKSMNKVPRRLFVFDFDYTLTSCNTDTIIYQLFENGQLPQKLKDQFKKLEWNRFVQLTLDTLREQGVTKDQISKVIRSAQPNPGIPELLDYLKKQGYSVVIASDANTWFIGEIVDENKIGHHFKEIFTNPLRIEGDRLVISPYEEGHGCPRCPPNICKTKIIRDFLKKDGHYDQIYYAGDGSNDFCPSLQIDCFTYCRAKFPLENLIKEKGKLEKSLAWESGLQILEDLKNKQSQ